MTDMIKGTKSYKAIEEWAIEPYTQQPWSHVMNEPLLQLGSGGLILTVKRHLVIVTTGVVSASLFRVAGLKQLSYRVLKCVGVFMLSVRSVIWLLMNWK